MLQRRPAWAKALSTHNTLPVYSTSMWVTRPKNIVALAIKVNVRNRNSAMLLKKALEGLKGQTQEVISTLEN